VCNIRHALSVCACGFVGLALFSPLASCNVRKPPLSTIDRHHLSANKRLSACDRVANELCSLHVLTAQFIDRSLAAMHGSHGHQAESTTFARWERGVSSLTLVDRCEPANTLAIRSWLISSPLHLCDSLLLYCTCARNQSSLGVLGSRACIVILR